MRTNSWSWESKSENTSRSSAPQMGCPEKARLFQASPSPQPFSPRYSGYSAALAQSQEPASTQALVPRCHPPVSRIPSVRLSSASAADLHSAHDTGPVPLTRPPGTTMRSPAHLPTHCAQAAVARVQQVRRAQSPSCRAGECGRQSGVQSSGAAAGGCLGLSGLAALPKGPPARRSPALRIPGRCG